MWKNLSVMENSRRENGEIDKSYIKLKTRKIYNAMMITGIQSFFITCLWLLTKSTWSIVFHFPFTVIELLWFYSEMKRGWKQDFWEHQKVLFESQKENNLTSMSSIVRNTVPTLVDSLVDNTPLSPIEKYKISEEEIKEANELIGGNPEMYDTAVNSLLDDMKKDDAIIHKDPFDSSIFDL